MCEEIQLVSWREWTSNFSSEQIIILQSYLKSHHLKIHDLITYLNYNQGLGLTQRRLGELLGVTRNVVQYRLKKVKERAGISTPNATPIPDLFNMYHYDPERDDENVIRQF